MASETIGVNFNEEQQRRFIEIFGELNGEMIKRVIRQVDPSFPISPKRGNPNFKKKVKKS